MKWLVTIAMFVLAYGAIVAEASSPDMVYIPGGTFEMGDNLGDGWLNQLPVHTVTVDSFYMGKYEITNRQYCDYLNSAQSQGLITVTDGVVYEAGGTSYPYCYTHISSTHSQIDYSDSVFTVRTKSGRDMSNDPMVDVSWYGAAAYCNWRSQEEGYGTCYAPCDPNWPCDFSKNGYRLATEAEWEYAARGGLPGRRFPWGDTITHSQANYYACPSCDTYDLNPTGGYHPTWNDGIRPYTSPGGSFAANGYGLYDMAGNVWEWCNDWYDWDYYDYSPTNNPTGPITGSHRVIRGGPWINGASHSSVTYRGGSAPPERNYTIGFRLARNAGCGSRCGDCTLGEGLVAYYPFNGNANDASGNGHHGDVRGDTVLTEDSFGESGRAYYFDGENDYIDLGSDPALAPETFSVSAWFKTSFSGTQNWRTIYGLNHVRGAQQFDVGINWSNNTSVLKLLVVENFLYGTTPLADDTWYHAVFVREGSLGRIFLNGNLEAESDAMSGIVSNNRSLPYYIGGVYETGGAGPANWEFEGSIDEVRIYDRALSGCEIRKLACAPEPVCWQEQVKLLASDGETEDRFGISVGISGNTAIVGAYMFGTSGWGGIGAAYLFDTTTGQQISKLTASDGDNRDQFGIGVAISGNTAIVGAYGDDAYTGSAYVFDVTDPRNPVQTHKLVASDRASPDMFGYTGIAISGSIAIIGAHGHDDAGFMSGSAYVFDLTSGSQIAKLTASDAAPLAYFGISCAISGSTAIVGACQGGQGCPSCPIPPGVAYLFDIRDPYHPVETCKLTASDPQGNDEFGFSVAIAGNAAVVGAHYHDGDGLTDCGAAYLFDVADIYNPILVRKLTASDPEAYGYFGHSVAITEDTAVVGAVWGDNEGLADCGSAYLFDATTGEQLCKLTASDGADYDQFGYSVAISGTTIVAGANQDDDSGSNSGSAYLFENICNAQPVADAGEDQGVSTGSEGVAEVTLDGCGSSDPDGDELTYRWYLEGEQIATGCNPVISLPCGTYTITLIVNDGLEDSQPDDVQITVLDGTPPIITCPRDVTLECPADTSPPATGLATATDNCDENPAITYGDVISGACPRVIERRWTATDETGNSSSGVQTITVQDTTPPVFTVKPVNKVVECDGAGNVVELQAWLGSAAATDTCTSVRITNNCIALSDGCGATGSATVTWTATDECGNSTTTSATFTIVDTTPPAITCPPDVTLECPADTSVGATGRATATDACGSVAITSTDVWTPGCGNTGTLRRTWTATDECGNSSMCVQVITVQDTTPPVFSVKPVSKVVECDGSGNTGELNAWLASAAAEDTCGEVTITHDFAGLSDECAATGLVLVTWRAVDDCGNTSTTSATFTIVDTTAPAINSLSANPSVLWAPNHKMEAVRVSVDTADVCDEAPVCRIINVTANEPINGKGDGNTQPDWEITGDLTVNLRAERSAKATGRVYTIYVESTDACGNSTVATVDVSVSHDQRSR